VAEPPVKLGNLDAVPPALRYRLRDALGLLPRDGSALDGLAAERLSRVITDGESWLGADPSLAEVGYWMLDAKHSVEMRQQGCIWLTRFPSVETAKRLSRVLADPTTPEPVREQATWTLGYRQLRGMPASTQWPADAVQIADEALGKLADAANLAGKVTSEKLPHALRHVQSDMTAAIFAKAPGLWGDALEGFATPPLARVLFVSIGDIPSQHRIRVLRLIAATLGEEAVPLLVSRSADVAIDEKLEMLFLAITFGGEKHLPRLEAALDGMKYVDLLRQRAKWHLQHPKVVPTVRGLRVARTTAVTAPADRAPRCRQAADDLGALTKFARHAESYLYTLWGWVVRGSGDPARARELVSAHPESQHLVRELYMEDLARRGRVKQLVAAAQSLQGADAGALQLAIWGRPFAALELAGTARLHTPELVCARALACYRAGRPDLTARILAEDLPPAEITADDSLAAFPGPNEHWMIERAPHVRPAIGALAKGLAGVLELAEPAPIDAEPDLASLAPIEAVVRRLGRGFPGSTVYLAGEFKHMNKEAITSAIEKAGARVVSGPFPGTDYYVHGDWCLVQTIAQLERQGARRIKHGELDGV
jgi:hypothetical protein